MNYLALALALLSVMFAIITMLCARRWTCDKKKSEEKILQLEEEKNARDRFYGIISHELKGTISSLVFLTSKLRERHKELDSPQVTDSLDMILKTTKDTLDLLENLLQWSLMNTGRIEARPKVFLLRNAIEDSARLSQDAAAAKQVVVSLDVPGDLRVYADENMTAFVIRNLLANALRAMDKPGEIRISCHDNGMETEIRVKDEGSGIQQADLENLLHLDKSRLMPGKGNGIGLVLCREFAEMNGGWLRVQSEPGRGSMFTFAVKKP